MSKAFVGSAGSSMGVPVYSGECDIPTVLGVITRQNYDRVAGFDLAAQRGVNRSWDRKRSAFIAQGMEERLRADQPLEHGAVILIDPERRVVSEELAAGGAVRVVVPDEVKLPLIDRQHTTGALEMARLDPARFPLLSAYVNDRRNTITVKVIQCAEREGRKRFEILNHRPKALSWIEKAWAMTINALDSEEAGRPEAYQANLPLIVSFVAWHDLAEDPASIWHGRLVVESTAAPPTGKKAAATAQALAQETTVVYQLFREADPGFMGLSIMEQADVIRAAVGAYWSAIARGLPLATGERWHDYLLLKTNGAKVMMKVMAGLIRCYLDRRSVKRAVPAEQSFLSRVSLRNFCSQSIPAEYMARAAREMKNSELADDEYWTASEVASGFKADKEEKGLADVWRKLNVHNLALAKWRGYINSYNTNEWQNKGSNRTSRLIQGMRTDVSFVEV